ncbi:hypothetical protein BJF90_13590 [Pseudonocardia sp. CNS-004]|nr:hypothetical protein BJF90_13590 [Pseudonocardia sp. CNS-004]
MATGDAEAIVVGGGIGGLAAALAVQRSGAFGRVRVLERADEFSEVGAGLQLGPNAIRALRALGIDEAIDDYAFYPRRLVMMNAVTGDMITAVDLGQASATGSAPRTWSCTAATCSPCCSTRSSSRTSSSCAAASPSSRSCGRAPVPNCGPPTARSSPPTW